jgi:hypothetical protein
MASAAPINTLGVILSGSALRLRAGVEGPLPPLNRFELSDFEGCPQTISGALGLR